MPKWWQELLNLSVPHFSLTHGPGGICYWLPQFHSIRDGSSFTFLRSGSGMFLEVCKATGVMSGLRLI